MDDKQIKYYIEKSVENIKSRLVDNLKFIFLWKEGTDKIEPNHIYISLVDKPDDVKNYASSITSPRDYKRIIFTRNLIDSFLSNVKASEHSAKLHEILEVDKNPNNIVENFFYNVTLHEIIHHLIALNRIDIKGDEESIVRDITIILMRHPELPIKLKQ